jgi:peptidoglycan DL-endopeptidase CwlO
MLKYKEVTCQMIKGTIVKVTLCGAAFILSLSIGATVKAATIKSDIGIAGITPVLESYYTATADQETGDAEKLLETLAQQVETKQTKTGVTEVVSPYANLGISIANDYVNIRSKANTESDVVGKLYRGCATDILEYEGDWVKIHSGNVDGYIKAEYLAIGEEAEKLIDEFASKYATIKTETLFVREGQGQDTAIITMVPLGETYYIKKEYDEWAEIEIDNEESGFVSKEYIDISVEFEYAISIEEEQAKIAAEEAAKRAEAERLAKLAAEEEEKERKAEEAKKAAAEKAAEDANNSKNNSSSNNSSSNNNSNNDSNNNSSSSSSGQEIANYALNFVGNPYVWGGTSLTGGADCSGFVQSIYSHFGRRIPRTSREQASGAGYEVSISDLQAGDLIFYRNSSGTVNHVALYIGNGKVVHASNQREGIKISSYNYRTPYKARRIL